MERSPDQFYTEQLLPSNPLNESEQIELSLQQSMLNYIQNNIQQHEEKFNLLYSKYKIILNKYKKLNRYDEDIRNFNDYIEPIVVQYCRDNNPIQLDSFTYDSIMKTIKSIRLTKDDIILMTQLFSKY